MKGEIMDPFLATAIFGHDDIIKSLDADNLGGDEVTPHPVESFLEKARFDALSKSTGAIANVSWDELLTTSPRTFSKGFEERSDERFEGVCAKIRTLFAGHDEYVQELIEVARRMRAEARAEVIAA
jgi:hypothetical protein